MDLDEDAEQYGSHAGEYFYDGTGSQHIDDNIYVFQDMERELETLVRKFQIAPADLENLCQVVMTMSEMMDQAREELHKVGEQKNELEKLWKTEKHNWGMEKKKNVEMDCRFEDERLKFEAERKNLETIKAQLQTKLNQTISQKAVLEQEVQRLKAKSENDELTRKKLVEQYKNQIAEAKITSTHKPNYLTHTPSPEPELIRRRTRASSLMLQSPQPDSKLSSANPPAILEGSASPHLAEELTITKESEELQVTPVVTESHPLQPENIFTEISHILPEAVLEGETHHVFRGREQAPCRPENTLGMSLQDELELVEEGNEASPSAQLDVLLKERVRWAEERTSLEVDLLRAREEKEALERHLAAQENLLAAEKADTDMLLKEKDHWDEEKAELVREGQKIREEKEALESESARLHVEVQLLKESECALNKELQEVRQDRDEILENYVDQPYENYCITRKELLDLLKMHQSTQIELEKEKEEKERLQKLLEEKTPWYNRFRTKVKSAFAKKEKPTQPVHSRRVKSPITTREPLGTASKSTTREAVGKELVSTIKEPVSTTRESIGTNNDSIGTTKESVTPVMGSIAPTVQVKEWLALQDSLVQWDSLPVWVGQIPLSGIETEQINCTAVGRTYLSEVVRTFNAPRPRASISSPPTTIVPQWASEVWVATNVGASAFIEILDVLKKHNRDTQRFLVKGAKRICCMLAVPGVVELSQDFLETSSITAKYLESMTPGGRKSRSEDELFSDDITGKPPSSKYMFPLEPIEDRTVPSVTSSRTKTSPVVHKELFKQDVKPGTAPNSDLGRPGHGGLGEELRHPDADNPEAAVMWVLTDDNCLCLYPTSAPCYQCLNRVQLSYKTFCIAHVRSRVLLGHTDSLITVYTKQANKNVWKIFAPDSLIELPSCSLSDEHPDVRCITEVGDRVWVAAGMSMFIYGAEDMAREGCIIVDGLMPEKIMCVGSCAVVSTGGPLLVVYDAVSTDQLRVIDITSSSLILDQPSLTGSATPPVSIRTMTADESHAYLGTSTGKVIAVSIPSLRPQKTKENDSCGPGYYENDSCNDLSVTLSLHSHHVGTASLMYVPLPKAGSPSPQGATTAPTHVPRPTLFSKSLLLSVGKGHAYLSEEKVEEEEPSAVLRERNDPFQLLVWGHIW